MVKSAVPNPGGLMTTIDALRTAVQDVFNDQADFDEVLARLDAQIDTAPASA